MNSGRQREAKEIVRLKRAAVVGRLMLGELNEQMESIFVEQYIHKSRRELKEERESIRKHLYGEINKFCRKNFENMKPEDLAKLYEPLFEHKNDWHMPLAEFSREFGNIKSDVLKGAPLHSTIHFSLWGLQTDFPEQHFMKDLAVSFNDAVSIEEHRLTDYRTKSIREKKDQIIRGEIADLIRRSNVNQRTCVLTCFNLIESYVNGLAWDYFQTHDISCLSKNDQEIFDESKKMVNIIDKLIKIPRIVAEKGTSPLDKSRDPLKSFIEDIKPYRDAIVHASPFAAPERFGGYDKLNKLYNLNLSTVRGVVDITIRIIKEIHSFLHSTENLPEWIFPRVDDDTFLIETGAKSVNET
jgi:hypothetical protein